MDIKELREIQNKAISVLNKFGTDQALNWFMNCSKSSNPFISIKTDGERAGKKIFRHIHFENDEDVYDLYLVNERTFSTYDSYATAGDFILYYNSEEVLETAYHVDEDEFGSSRSLYFSVSRDMELKDGKVHTLPGSTKQIKLMDWVENIPRIVEMHKEKIRLKQEQIKRNKDAEEVRETSNKFDLGKYQ